jgi:hypothetical protein
MKINDIIKFLVNMAINDENKYFDIVHAIALIFPDKLVEQLNQIAQKPIWDGDIISPSYRNELLDMKLAVKICFKREQGYTSATNIAYSILKIIDPPKAEEPSKG